MTVADRKKKLAYAEKMYAETQRRIRRLNTALKNWERRVKHQETEIAKALEHQVASLEAQLANPHRRAISLEDVR